MNYLAVWSNRKNAYVLYRRMWKSAVGNVAIPAFEIMFEGAKFHKAEHALDAAEHGLSLGDILFQATPNNS